MLRYLLRRFSAKQVIPEFASLRTSDFLVRLLEGHDIECTTHNDWVLPNSELPALRATWFPGSSNGRLDVQAFVREGAASKTKCNTLYCKVLPCREITPT